MTLGWKSSIFAIFWQNKSWPPTDHYNEEPVKNLKINPRGGLIGCGHPLGATGIAQTIEIVQQLQNNAEKRQVENTDVGLVHNMSAAATSSTILVLEK